MPSDAHTYYRSLCRVRQDVCVLYMCAVQRYLGPQVEKSTRFFYLLLVFIIIIIIVSTRSSLKQAADSKTKADEKGRKKRRVLGDTTRSIKQTCLECLTRCHFAQWHRAVFPKTARTLSGSRTQNLYIACPETCVRGSAARIISACALLLLLIYVYIYTHTHT